MAETTTTHIDPSEEQIAGFVAAAQSADGPVVMINLLTFNDAPDGGRDSYARYARAVQPHLDRVGARILYAGDAREIVIGGEDLAWWDTVVVVEYPSRAKFLEMVFDPGYQAIAVHRSAALTTSALVATDPWQPEA
ncbi:DUF1330 domain-containing protein [Nocardia sp. CA-129566]|uniref:DUF1330 domain-containing protein n=1 Tax=Nocardia sp. CA-129566 TaxID=3239976 RepID=UPI003D956FA8